MAKRLKKKTMRLTKLLIPGKFYSLIQKKQALRNKASWRSSFIGFLTNKGLAESLSFLYKLCMRLCLAPLLGSLLILCSGCTLGTNHYTPQRKSAPSDGTAPVANASPERRALPTNFPTSPLSLPPSAPPPIQAESAIVVDALTGKPLFQKNADTPRQVASTQKLVTALVVAEAGNLHKPVTIQSCDLNVQPTRLNFRPGDVYERGELLHALMVKSCNDVACALGRDVAGSVPAFAQKMNQKAAAIGMRNSCFKNPHGLTEPGQYSTARDMARCALVAYRDPVIRQFIGTQTLNFTFASGKQMTLNNTNRLLKSLPWCTGMKTGTTDAAGRCLIISGGINGRHAIAVVLGSNTANIWRDSELLIKWALSQS